MIWSFIFSLFVLILSDVHVSAQSVSYDECLTAIQKGKFDQALFLAMTTIEKFPESEEAFAAKWISIGLSKNRLQGTITEYELLRKYKLKLAQSNSSLEQYDIEYVINSLDLLQRVFINLGLIDVLLFGNQNMGGLIRGSTSSSSVQIRIPTNIAPAMQKTIPIKILEVQDQIKSGNFSGIEGISKLYTQIGNFSLNELNEIHKGSERADFLLSVGKFYVSAVAISIKYEKFIKEHRNEDIRKTMSNFQSTMSELPKLLHNAEAIFTKCQLLVNNEYSDTHLQSEKLLRVISNIKKDL